MDVRTKDELKAEAKALGIEIKGNPSVDTLKQKLDDFYESQSAGDLVKAVVEEVDDTEDEVKTDTPEPKGKGKGLTKDQILRKRINEAKKTAMKKSVVTITSNDKRDNDVATVAYLGFENQYFSVSKLVPLDVPLELEECLIEIARTTEVTLHKDEIVNGRRTGNKVPVRTRKLNISYERV